MRFLWRTMLKDLRVALRNPTGVLLWVGIPLVIGSLMVMASGGRDGPKPQAHLLVADLDDSFVSGMLVGALSQDAAGGMIRAESVSEAEGRARMERGDATALLVIPDGFGQAVFEETPMQLELVTNPSQTILPGIVEESLSILVDAGFYLHRLVGDEMRRLAQGPPPGANTLPDTEVAALSVRFNQLADRLAKYLSPPVIGLDKQIEEDPDQARIRELGFGVLFLPGILFMSLLFMSQGVSEDLWDEHQKQTLRRVLVTPHHAGAFLGGKLLAGGVLMLGVVLLALAVGILYFDLPKGSLPLAALWSAFTGLFLLTAFTLMQTYASSQRAGNILSMSIVFPLMMVGGSMFPFEVMPDWMAAVGRWTPNGWALMQLRRILLQDIDAGGLAATTGGLLGVTLLLFLWTAARLRRRFATA